MTVLLLSIVSALSFAPMSAGAQQPSATQVQEALQQQPANATARFDITVANVRANQVYVLGEVSQPGAYQISSLGTVLTALHAAGGVTERAKQARSLTTPSEDCGPHARPT